MSTGGKRENQARSDQPRAKLDGSVTSHAFKGKPDSIGKGGKNPPNTSSRGKQG